MEAAYNKLQGIGECAVSIGVAPPRFNNRVGQCSLIAVSL